MGILICLKHGQQGVVPFIELEIAQKINDGIPISKDEIETIKADFYDDAQKLIGTTCYMLYANTVKQNEFRKKYSIFTEEQELDLLTPIQLVTSGSVCSKCLEEYKITHGWDIEFPCY